MTIRNRAEIRQLQDDLAEAEKLQTHVPQQPVADNKPPRPAQEGHKWEWHGDHWHEMPIAAAQPVAQPVQVKQPEKPMYTGPLTYHTELLKTNPVEALRLQAEERGHWSAKWIPPFPPDDLEAAEIARTNYLLIYYHTIGDTDNPEFKKASRAAAEQRSRRAKALREAYNGRVADLMILIWAHYPESDVPPLYENGWRKSPSDYFPESIEDLKFPLSNPK
jgi:hypothetical protein